MFKYKVMLINFEKKLSKFNKVSNLTYRPLHVSKNPLLFIFWRRWLKKEKQEESFSFLPLIMKESLVWVGKFLLSIEAISLCLTDSSCFFSLYKVISLFLKEKNLILFPPPNSLIFSWEKKKQRREKKKKRKTSSKSLNIVY